MTVAILDGPAVLKFVEDGEAFNKCVDEHFMVLDVNGDGVLSRAELLKEFEYSVCEMVFERFDSDKNGTVDVEEFRSEMKEIMLAVAYGLGDSPVQVALEYNSFLTKAFEHEMGMQVEQQEED